MEKVSIQRIINHLKSIGGKANVDEKNKHSKMVKHNQEDNDLHWRCNFPAYAIWKNRNKGCGVRTSMLARSFRLIATLHRL